MAEASRRGTILLVLRLAKSFEDTPLGDTQNGFFNPQKWSENPVGPGTSAPQTAPGLNPLRSDSGVVPPTAKTLPSPDELRTILQPFAKQVTEAEARVKELEAVYFKDRSNAAELQIAWDELSKKRKIGKAHV